ncbi:MAG: hypothetical protein AB7P16_24720 [Bradyrhizobium sp.]|uniref:hypothetical protein n=1 Tax=Bradyrhizobium sp. TaxID=376 RepID=UPI003D14311A
MKAPETMIEKAAASKDIRFYLNTPILDVERSRLIASDGCIAASVPVTVAADDHSGAVPIEALKRARKSSRAKHEDALSLNGSAKLADGTSMPRPDIGEGLPPYVPHLDRMIEDARVTDREPDLIIDAALLLRLAEALNHTGKGNTGVQIWVKRETAEDGTVRTVQGCPIYVRPCRGDATAHGLIMQRRR